MKLYLVITVVLTLVLQIKATHNAPPEDPKEKCCNSSSMEVNMALPPVATHGEGPFYKYRENVLYFVDTFAPAIVRWEIYTNEVTKVELDGNSVGMIIGVRNSMDQFVVGRDSKLDILTWDGKSNNTGTLKNVGNVEPNQPKVQFNDGKADRRGNLWLGTLTREPNLTVDSFEGNLYYIKGYALENQKVVLPNVSVSNGLVFSKDQQYIFYIDSESRQVVRYEINLKRGQLKQNTKEIVIDLANYPELQGIPDGMTIDDSYNLFVALHGGGAVLQVDSRQNVKEPLLRVIEMPVSYPTSLAFGSPDLDVLYVTTSRLRVSNAVEPLAGSIFAITGLCVQGYPPDEAIIVQ